MEPSPYESVPPPVMSEQPPEPPSESSDRKKKIIIVAAAAAVVIILLAVAYVLWAATNKPTQPVKQVDTPKSQGTGNQDIDEATSLLTDGIDDEMELTDTDDAAKADDAIQSAANVGNSLNENNF